MGSSIGTLTINGDYNQAAGSILFVEVTPAAVDLLDVNAFGAATGAVTISSSATLCIQPDIGSYPPLTTYVIIDAEGGVTGKFAEPPSIKLPTFSAEVIYTANQVLLGLGLVPLQTLDLSGPAKIAAACFEEIPNNLQIQQIRFMQIPQIEQVMLKLLPTLFSDLDLAQEATIVRTRETISREMNILVRKVCGKERKLRIWSDIFWGKSSQDSKSFKPGYYDSPVGEVLGFDYQINPDAFIGIIAGHSQNHLRWMNDRGSARMSSGYNGIYTGGWLLPKFYGQAALIVSRDYYRTNREVFFEGELFDPFTLKARGRTSGLSVLTHLEMGRIWDSVVRNRFFGKLDYSIINRRWFEEQDADSINLTVKTHTADLFRFEIGDELSYCFRLKQALWTPHVTAGGIFEHRSLGKKQEASFDTINCPMIIEGIAPNRKLFFWEVGLLGQIYRDHLDIAANFRGEYGSSYFSHNWSAELKFSF